MSFITLDFETYYAQDYTLSKLTTEEYVNKTKFEVIGVGVKVDDEPAVWFSGSREDTKVFLTQFDWAESALLCHNTMFDGAILAWKFNIRPAFYFDTLCMARSIHGVDAGGSLKALTERYALGAKGTEVEDAKGKKRRDFTPEDLAQYGEYCKNDVDLTKALFRELASNYPPEEFSLIDMTLRMFIDPILEVDDAMLEDRLHEVRQEKLAMLGTLMEKLNCETEEAVRKKLASNNQFAELLKEHGAEAPTKISKTTGKETFALAKNDEGFISLTAHDDPFIQQLCAVRLGTKSTIEESRIERFIGVGARNKGRLPIPLKYYGAHTGRWSGVDKVNFQNLPSRDKKKKTLKNAIIAPYGHVMINCDSSQIEARVLAWLAGQEDLVTSFANGEDVYSVFATKIYKDYPEPITKANPIERFVGKTCLTASTRVLTRRGWVRIIEVTVNDQLWDGIEWVNHHGVSYMGQKQTINLHGLELTPDHEILTGHTKWETAHTVLTQDTVFQSALALATSSWSGINNTSQLGQTVVGDGSHFAGVYGAVVSTHTQVIISKREGQRRVMGAQNVKPVISGGGNTSQFYRTISTGLGFSIGFHLQSPDVTTLHVKPTYTMVQEGFLYHKTGGMVERSFSNMPKRFLDGITRVLRWIGLTSTEDTKQGIYDLYHARTTFPISEKSQTLKPVYDILNSGLRNRFTVLTDAGPLIVHNCILGLGYGTGALKLQHTLKTTPPGVALDEAKCIEIVDLYRQDNDKIITLWRDGDKMLTKIADWNDEKSKEVWYGKHKCLRVNKEGIRLPNGLYIRYPDLKDVSEDGKPKYAYTSRKGTVHLWGGTVVENVVQALARIIVGQQMLEIQKRYKVVLTVHDAAVCVVPVGELQEAIGFITKIMSTAPEWAEGLPVACEAKYGDSYGEC